MRDKIFESIHKIVKETFKKVYSSTTFEVQGIVDKHVKPQVSIYITEFLYGKRNS